MDRYTGLDESHG